MKVDDGGSYASLLEGLSALREAVRPSKAPSSEGRRRAKLLKSILGVIAEEAEAHAIKQSPGLASALHTEINGSAGLPIFRRFGAALSAAAGGARAAASRSSGAAAGAGAGAGASAGASGSLAAMSSSASRGASRAAGLTRGGGARPRDLSSVVCFGCLKTGHYQSMSDA